MQKIRASFCRGHRNSNTITRLKLLIRTLTMIPSRKETVPFKAILKLVHQLPIWIILLKILFVKNLCDRYKLPLGCTFPMIQRVALPSTDSIVPSTYLGAIESRTEINLDLHVKCSVAVAAAHEQPLRKDSCRSRNIVYKIVGSSSLCFKHNTLYHQSTIYRAIFSIIFPPLILKQ